MKKLTPAQRAQYIGNVYKKLQIVDTFKKLGNDSRFKVVCECQCTEVLYMQEILDWGECSKCRKETNRQTLIEVAAAKCKLTRQQAIDDKLREYISGANSRNLQFTISRELFTMLITSNCHYCGTPPNRKKNIIGGVFEYLGIDRKNNDRGYVNGNCVSCCWDCNKLKGTRTYEEFVAYLDRVAAYRSKLR